jgi:hypothetical protein
MGCMEDKECSNSNILSTTCKINMGMVKVKVICQWETTEVMDKLNMEVCQ